MTFDIKGYLKDAKNKPLVLDGGLGAQLEDTGFDDDMNDALWSTILVFKYPQEIYRIHTDFLNNGADVVTIATYQTSELGLKENAERLGLQNDEQVRQVFVDCIDIGDRARNDFWAANESSERIRPLVAGSIGPFGAYVADRSEYTGFYPSISANFDSLIRDFHRLRLEVLLNDARVDFNMLETIPNFQELKLLVDLIHEFKNDALYTVSLSLKSPQTLLDGTDLKEIMEYINGLPEAKRDQIIAIGTNCSPLFFSADTMAYLNSFNKLKIPLVVYPNKGEIYDKSVRRHTPDPLLVQYLQRNKIDPENFHDLLVFLTKQWVANGARIVGGCCRITPTHIKWIHDSV